MRSSKGHVSPRLPSVPASRLRGHDGAILAITFTKNGKYALTAGQDRTVRLWNPRKVEPGIVPTFTLLASRSSSGNNTADNDTQFYASIPAEAIPTALSIKTYPAGHAYEVTAVAIDDDSKIILSASDKAVFASDVMSGAVLRRLHGHTARVNTVACNHNASVILSGSYDGTVKCWDNKSSSKEPIETLTDATDSVTSILVHGHEVISASVDGRVRTYDLRMGELRTDYVTEHSALTSLAMSHDNQCLAVSCLDAHYGTIHLLERSTGSILASYSGHHRSTNYGVGVGITSDDCYIVTGSEDGMVPIYDLASKELVQCLEGHSRHTCAVACNPDPKSSNMVISGSYDGHAVVWTTPEDVLGWQK